MRNWLKVLNRRLGWVLGSPTPWIFAGGVLAIEFISNGLAGLLGELFPRLPLVGSLLTALVGVGLLAAILLSFDLPKVLRTWFDRLLRRRPPTVEVFPHVPPHSGLVALVSVGRGPLPAEGAMAYHCAGNGYTSLTDCWLLAGPGEGELSSQANAAALKDIYTARGVNVRIISINDADDPELVYNAVLKIYDNELPEARLSPEQVIADFTGGTKSMTFGMVLACASRDWKMQFMKPNAYGPDGRPAAHAASTPRMVDINFFAERQPDGLAHLA